EPGAFHGRDPHELMRYVYRMVIRTLRSHDQLVALDEAVAIDRERVVDALADVIHRLAYGRIDGVNVRPGTLVTPAASADPLAVPRARGGDDTPKFGPAGMRTRQRFIDAGRKVFVQLGYHDARVDDV